MLTGIFFFSKSESEERARWHGFLHFNFFSLFNLRRREENSLPKKVLRHTSQLLLTLRMKGVCFKRRYLQMVPPLNAVNVRHF